LLGFEPERCRVEQWYGHCPLPACRQSSRMAFSVNLAMGRYCCQMNPECGAASEHS
jgi:hypothetical protein